MRIAFNSTLAALGLAAAMAAGTAAAAPIENWEYTVSSVFVTTPGATTFIDRAQGCESVTASAITWGVCPSGPAGEGRSGLGITNSPQEGTLVTNGAAQGANTYTHDNNVVSSLYRTLSSATISATLGLKVAGSAGPYEYRTATYDILFAETTNTEGTCVAESPVGNPCNDIWVLDGSLNNSFIIDGYQYYFSFFASPALNALPDAVCAAAGASDNCIGFTTVEGQANAVNFLLRLTSEQLVVEVPEPASIALLGAGLLGLAGIRRRQRNKA